MDIAPSPEGEYKRSYSGRKCNCILSELQQQRKQDSSTLAGAARHTSQTHTLEGGITHVHMSHVDRCYFKHKTTVTALGYLALQKIRQLILLLNQDFWNLILSLIYSFSILQLDQSDQAHEVFTQKCVSKFRNIILIFYVTTSFWKVDSCISLCSLWYDG